MVMRSTCLIDSGWWMNFGLNDDQDVGELLRRAGLVDGGRLVRSEDLGDQVARELGEGLDLGHARVDDHITLEDALATRRVVEGRVDMNGRHERLPPRKSGIPSVCHGHRSTVAHAVELMNSAR